MSLRGKNIVLGITGGIAAYKIPLLVRLLIKAGANVQVVMTEAAKDFVTPLTLSVLSRRPVLSSFVSGDGQWNNHVETVHWADLILVAPLTANTLANLVAGKAEDFLTAVVMSAEAPVYVSPAMDREMYRYPAVKENLDKLRSFGMRVIPAEEGELASGLTGQGRMPEPETLFEIIRRHFESDKPLAGKKVLITGGPTYEAIDPVRFIGNRSSGKMGIALAGAASEAGAGVTLITGPSAFLPENPPFEVVYVESAEEMFDAVKERYPSSDILIMSAAVSDYKPVATATSKIKKQSKRLHLELEPTPDILAEAGKMKREGQLNIGFALETDREKENAKDKLKRKNLDMIVLNSLKDEGAGFGFDTNKITVIHKDGTEKSFPLKSKYEVARDIISEISSLV